MKQKRQSKGKEIRPTFFVFCEGETEEAYVKFLRSQYRAPVEIAIITQNSISHKEISKYKKQQPEHEKDRTFLMYDLDVEGVLQKLQKIKNVDLLCSNPCFELWYLLHFQNQTAELTGKKCISELKKYSKQYQKSILDEKLKEKLNASKEMAVKRANELTEFKNPSTLIYRLLDELDKIKGNTTIKTLTA